MMLVGLIIALVDFFVMIGVMLEESSSLDRKLGAVLFGALGWVLFGYGGIGLIVIQSLSNIKL